MNCKNKRNYSKELDYGSLNFKGSNLNEVIESIQTRLKGFPFSTSFDTSQNPESFEESINKLSRDVISKLKEKGLIKGKNQEAKIKNIFKQLLQNRTISPIELNISSVLHISDGIVSQKDSESNSLKEITSLIYKGNKIIDDFRQDDFEQNLLIKTIIDSETEQVIDSKDTLNEAIEEFLESLYQTILSYLESQLFDISLLPKKLFDLNHNYSDGYNGVFQIMYNLIKFKNDNNSLEPDLEQSWIDNLIEKQENSLYNAINAYINLLYFDDVLQKGFDKYIVINKRLNLPIIRQGSDNKYKYSFMAGNSNSNKLHGLEFQDSLSQMSKFSQVLIKAIPIYDFKSKLKLLTRLTPKEFLGATTRLFDIALNTPSANKIQQLLKNHIILFKSNPSLHLYEIFNLLFNEGLINDYNFSQLDSTQITTLYSIFKTLFDGEKSWKAIEDKLLREKGITTRYRTVDTIIGVIFSNVAMNYLQTVYNFNTSRYETNIKTKYPLNKPKFDLIDGTNSLILNNENKQLILNEHSISYNETKSKNYPKNSYIVKFGEYEFVIKLSGIDLLSKPRTSKDITVEEISKLLEEILNKSGIDLSSTIARKHFLNSQTTSQEKKLFEVLKFIDLMLNTNFTKDVDGLLELILYLNLNNSGLKDLFVSASRALLITDVYNLFENSFKIKTKERYPKTEFELFLIENPQIYPIGVLNLKKSFNEYFVKTDVGNLLRTIGNNENWVEELSKVRAILSGDTQVSVIKNLEGSNVPNNSPAFLGVNLESLLKESQGSKKASAALLFSRNAETILKKVINSDIKTVNGNVKSISDMSIGELFFDSIYNKFIIPMAESNYEESYTLPTVYADKTKFVSYLISIRLLGINPKDSSFNEKIEQLLINTIGVFYNEVYKTTLEKYSKIFENEIINGNPIVTNGIVNLSLVQNWMKNHKLSDLLKLVNNYNLTHPNDNIVLKSEIDYRKLKGCLSINELLFYYAKELYTPQNLHNRLELEKINFVNELLKNRVYFNVKFNSVFELDIHNDPLAKMLSEFSDSESWVKGNKLVLAKVTNAAGITSKITHGQIVLKEGDVFELNPVLNTYFMIDNLIGNNMRYNLTGSELNHKIKNLNNPNLVWDKIKQICDKINEFEFTNEVKLLFDNFIKLFNLNYSGSQLTYYELQDTLNNVSNIENLSESEKNIISILTKAYYEGINELTSMAQNALFKRNVTIPGTMRYYSINNIKGIRDKMKVAVIDDILAKVFNFDGKTKSNDAHDGGAFVDPLTSILENLSLEDFEVGSVKKPILHDYDDETGTAILFKYAVSTISNEKMRQSEGNLLFDENNGITLREIFKKMTNFRWSENGEWKYGEVDLINGCGFKDDSTIIFSDDIMEGKNLYYKNEKGEHIRIDDFGQENRVYYTDEIIVDSSGNLLERTSHRVYHYFDDLGNHYPDSVIGQIKNVHTIDSLFELHTALGGIYSESLINGKLGYSEASNYAVVNYMNNVAIQITDNPNSIDLNNYHQPLKHALINCLLNQSAVKNGAANINPESSFYDKTPLSIMEVRTKYYGIQLDANHHVDESTMTEFSLVISSLDTGGLMHDYVAQIYETLGEVALLLASNELVAVLEFKSGNISKLYEIIGRTIIDNFKKDKGKSGLANAILKTIEKNFDLNIDHKDDEFKIPFSDSNIYQIILPTFVSIINSKSIKRKYPGSGTILVPSFNMNMVYDIDGNVNLFDDLVNKAILSGKVSSEFDLSRKKQDIVKQYLEEKLKEMPQYLTTEFLVPTDNVVVYYENENGEQKEYTLKLDDINDYYKFTSNPIAYLNGKIKFIKNNNIKFAKDIRRSRNLAPQRITFKYMLDGVEHQSNIFNHYRLKGLMLELNNISNLNISKSDKTIKEKLARQNWNVQKAFEELENGEFEIEPGIKVKVYDIQNKAAELMMPSIYKTLFGLNETDSLIDIKNKGINYFIQSPELISSNKFDIAFTENNGDHLYLTFNNILINNSDSKYRKWNKIHRSEYKIENIENSDVVHRIYATKNNINLFEIGREVIVSDVKYNPKDKIFTRNGSKAEGNYRRYKDDQVIEYIEFVSEYTIIENGEKYTLYNINKDAIERVFKYKKINGHYLSDEEYELELNEFIGKLIIDIYNTRDFNGLQLNSTLSTQSAIILKSIFPILSNLLKYDKNLSEYINELNEIIEIDEDEEELSLGLDVTIALNSYYNKLASDKYISFLKSLYFTAARIPAQTLQSFMKMENVGFLQGNNNHCLVSHWQAWLLGSKFNIN